MGRARITIRNQEAQRAYLAIDLKSFYASVECVARGLDPLTAQLVVADGSRTNKTVCLAVTPALKQLGVRNRCRLFEIPPGIEYIMVPPRMSLYVQVSAEIYGVYLKFFSPEDIHVYSIDEVFIDITGYLDLYGCTPRELGERVRSAVVEQTGIPATCGLGTNLYLAKVALDIMAKRNADFFGELTEEAYCIHLWNHTPITDFWRIGPGYAQRLQEMGITTMGQIALYPAEPLYQAFGIDAEILIDHAWGREPVRISDIKNYSSHEQSLSTSQVIGTNRDFAGGLIIAKEMADDMALTMVKRKLIGQIVRLYVGYAVTKEEREQIQDLSQPRAWRELPAASGSIRLLAPTNSREALINAVRAIYEQVVNPARQIHRISLDIGSVLEEERKGIQSTLFEDASKRAAEHRRQKAIAAIKDKYGKNALLKGIDYLPEATARERNAQIGGHRSGSE